MGQGHTLRVGRDGLLVGAQGKSMIPGPDAAMAPVDEIRTPAHRSTRFCVAR
ncbi:hypothetical protein LO771_27610 [Streptacidiphilus sp. ASG 303]|uniref:hypothetical protein n=1 Tax=Streptacidiphilus sp. ASG 303 TaxID=2896847 RepID=UPI001E5B3885|nr:hypothetical protein [Streptacidiphilus sp. ASG 303]MCD0486052.1 hypothetical protein [Streptacidiphilus sp. ASG 303]